MSNGSAASGNRSSPGNAATSIYATLQRFWHRTYAGDYLGIIILVIAYLLIQMLAQPFHTEFRLNDPRIQHPHAEYERVPPIWLIAYAVVLPLALLTVWAFAMQPAVRKMHVVFLGFAAAVTMNQVLTDVLKNAIGRPRPDLLARCQPDPATPRDQLVTVDVCRQPDAHRLHDGWKSYPSGHSSLSFAGLGWLALFLASQTHALRPNASLVVALVCLLPVLGAALIAISRLEDYRHDVFDVVCGSLLGFAIATFHWLRYFPSLLAKTCDEPYPPPDAANRSSPSGVYRLARDEEEVDVRDFGVDDDGVGRYGIANGER